MIRALRPVLVLLVFFSALLGFAYPAAVWSLGHFFMPGKASGEMLFKNGGPVGLALIGQPFEGPRWFHGRPAVADPMSAGASQRGAANPLFLAEVKNRLAGLQAPVPSDLVTGSGSGLDPDISPEAALYQAPRVAAARGLSVEAVTDLVEAYAEARTFGFLGEPRVNILRLNLALDSLSETPEKPEKPKKKKRERR